MNARTNKGPKRWLVLTPTLGIGLFGLLYVMAACRYPGGSNANQQEAGFSWQHNYWCDLLGSVGKNGMINPAQPIALTAMLVLGGSLAVFWWLLPYLFAKPNRYIRVGQWAGSLAMLIVLFIGTTYHDWVMNVAGCFGAFALVTTFVGLYQNRLFKLVGYGLFCIGLIGLNNYVYYTGQFFSYLPVIQKITFVLFLLWIVLINKFIYQKGTT